LQFIDQIDPSNPLPLLTLDPMRIDQILSNLLSNALRFTPNEGSVSLELSRLPYAACVTVHDSGPGIPPEALPHVFERFYRADRSRSRSEGGTGLGLAIARQLAETQHGSLIAQNHPEGGAMFTLTLPLPPEGAIVSPSSNSG
jgi:signal transduction histidine kinase